MYKEKEDNKTINRSGRGYRKLHTSPVENCTPRDADNCTPSGSVDWAKRLESEAPVFAPTARRRSVAFIKGPIPFEWMREACRRKACILAVYILWKVGILGAHALIELRPAEVRKHFGLSSFSLRDQRKKLESAGLVTAVPRNGRCKAVRVNYPVGWK